MKSQITTVDGQVEAITVFHDGSLLTALRDHHPNFQVILDRLTKNAKDAGVVDLFDVARSIVKRFQKVSERVNLANGQVLFDGEVVNNSLTEQVLRFVEEGRDDFKPLALFMEKIHDNPQTHSRDQLFDWLTRHKFTIDKDGDIIAYKGVQRNADGSLVSISHGPAIVDGKPVNGAVPNEVGSVVEMARGTVNHNPRIGCSSGLHVGTWDYAHSFARGAVLKCKVNPRDVVSVPTDCNWQKVRTCRYTVLEVVDGPVNTAQDDDVYDAPVTVTAVDTRKNHLSQKRGPNGRFLPKTS